jgi:hypothetical protein
VVLIHDRKPAFAGHDEDASQRGQQSPDRAEALVLAFARAVPRQQTVAFSQRVSISPI